MCVVNEHIMITIKIILFILNKTTKLGFIPKFGTKNIFIKIKTKTKVGLTYII